MLNSIDLEQLIIDMIITEMRLDVMIFILIFLENNCYSIIVLL